MGHEFASDEYPECGLPCLCGQLCFLRPGHTTPHVCQWHGTYVDLPELDWLWEAVHS